MIGCVQVGVSRLRGVDGTRGGSGTRDGDRIRVAGHSLAMLSPVARHTVVDRVAVLEMESGS